jgi:putative membrane protein
MEQTPAVSSNVLAQQRTGMAVSRTVMAGSRSLMAWVRTGLSMIGFGFTLYKFLQSFQEQLVHPNAPRNVGLLLIGLGTISVLAGCAEYIHTMLMLRQEHGTPIKKFPLVFAGVIGAIGVLLFVSIILRIG